MARWVTGPENSILRISDRSSTLLCLDADQNYVALFKESFYLKYAGEKFPELKFETKS